VPVRTTSASGCSGQASERSQRRGRDCSHAFHLVGRANDSARTTSQRSRCARYQPVRTVRSPSVQCRAANCEIDPPSWTARHRLLMTNRRIASRIIGSIAAGGGVGSEGRSSAGVVCGLASRCDVVRVACGVARCVLALGAGAVSRRRVDRSSDVSAFRLCGYGSPGTSSAVRCRPLATAILMVTSSSM
jgi:hypothetical protein